MITSRSNALVKLIRSLSDKKYRDETGLFIIEGVKAVDEAFSLGVAIKHLVGTESGLKKLDFPTDSAEVFSDGVFAYVSADGAPQGVLALAEKPRQSLVPPSGDCLLLDGVSDPANVGAIIRTAAAAGFNQIYVANGADPYSPKSVRASMSGIFRVKVFYTDIDSALSVIDAPLVVADMNGTNVYDFAKTENICLVIGNEGHGVSEKVRNSAKLSVSIPMKNGTESLNAAVSAGILMYLLH